MSITSSSTSTPGNANIIVISKKVANRDCNLLILFYVHRVVKKNVMHFIVFIIVLYADIDLNFFKTFVPNCIIVFYNEIAYLIITAAHTLIDCIVHRKANKLDILLWYECYCIVTLGVLKVIHLVGLTCLSSAKSCENLVPFFA